MSNGLQIFPSDILHGYWTLILIVGRDGVVRGARLKTAKGNLERAIQQLCPLELSCDIQQTTPLNPTAETFEPRPKRGAAAARLRIQQVAEDEQEDD